MAGLLMSETEPNGTTKLRHWMGENRDGLGRRGTCPDSGGTIRGSGHHSELGQDRAAQEAADGTPAANLDSA